MYRNKYVDCHALRARNDVAGGPYVIVGLDPTILFLQQRGKRIVGFAVVVLGAHVFGGGFVLFYGAGGFEGQAFFHGVDFFYNYAHRLANLVNLAQICVCAYVFKVAYVNKAVNARGNVYKKTKLCNAADFAFLL